jgi:uncharacterized protein YecT (DUF1311 family)
MIRTSAIALALLVAWPACAQTDEEVAAQLTPEFDVCEHSPGNGGTFQQALCYKDEDARQDELLNEAWAKVIERTPPVRREALRKDERRWIRERDATCREEAAAYINSTAAFMFNHCMAEETIRRTIWLNEVR